MERMGKGTFLRRGGSMYEHKEAYNGMLYLKNYKSFGLP